MPIIDSPDVWNNLEEIKPDPPLPDVYNHADMWRRYNAKHLPPSPEPYVTSSCGQSGAFVRCGLTKTIGPAKDCACFINGNYYYNPDCGDSGDTFQIIA